MREGSTVGNQNYFWILTYLTLLPMGIMQEFTNDVNVVCFHPTFTRDSVKSLKVYRIKNIIRGGVNKKNVKNCGEISRGG